ncbi:MAG: UbiA family prenyltransferase, partial [Planctomycetia bacterium]
MGSELRWASGLAWLKLVRAPALPTAPADIAFAQALVFAAAALQGRPDAVRWTDAVLLAGASLSLYAAGMIWNDYFDVAVDRRERPARPLPAGLISETAAARAATVLMAVGVLLAGLVGPISALVAAALVAAVFAYDAALKHTPVGPPAMGVCRTLNLLLGLSPMLQAPGSVLAGGAPNDVWLAAAANGVFIAGVTWTARDEAGRSRRPILLLGGFTAFCGLALHAVLFRDLAAWAKPTAGPAAAWLLL